MGSGKCEVVFGRDEVQAIRKSAAKKTKTNKRISQVIRLSAILCQKQSIQDQVSPQQHAQVCFFLLGFVVVVVALCVFFLGEMSLSILYNIVISTLKISEPFCVSLHMTQV